MNEASEYRGKVVLHAADRRVAVDPFTSRVEGDEAIIANSSQTSFLAIPRSALDLLTELATGRTIAEAQATYLAKYGETPDVDDFLDLLASEGFVKRSEDDLPSALPMETVGRTSATVSAQRYHFENISERTARLLLGAPVLVGCGLVIALALFAVLGDPTLIPSPTVMVFKSNLTPLTLAMIAFVLVTIFLHEMAHLIGARAAGAPARLGLSNRLWYLVAETDLTGVWLASRRQRYLAFLAGPLLDAGSSAVLILLLWTNRQWPWLSAFALLLCQVFLFTYLMRLLWQTYFFVRTDFYYVVATFFNCKNLLSDTEDWLRNQLARFWPGLARVDQSMIPTAELRVIRAYAIVWLLGRGVAFGSLIWISLPIFWGYWLELSGLFGGSHGSAYALIDASLWTSFTLGVEGAGLFLWLRGIYRSRFHARRVKG